MRVYGTNTGGPTDEADGGGGNLSVGPTAQFMDSNIECARPAHHQLAESGIRSFCNSPRTYSKLPSGPCCAPGLKNAYPNHRGRGGGLTVGASKGPSIKRRRYYR